MFGYVKPGLSLSRDERGEYSVYYCGLCEALRKKYGEILGLTLTYDMTFLAMFLSSLYEPEEKEKRSACMPHPLKKHVYVESSVMDYACDMSVILTYHKLEDDLEDRDGLFRGTMKKAMEKAYTAAKVRLPGHEEKIKEYLHELSEYENSESYSAEACASTFGMLLSCVFLYRDDRWSREVMDMAYSLGRFIYIQDDFCDAAKDIRRRRNNTFSADPKNAERAESLMSEAMNDCMACFERLPLEKNIEIMRKILSEGAWQNYVMTCAKRRTGKENGKGAER